MNEIPKIPFFTELIFRLESARDYLYENEQTREEDGVDKAIDILQKLESWCDAYPEDIFIPMSSDDWKEHHALLKGSDRSGSAAAADCMRHVVNGFKKVLHDE